MNPSYLVLSDFYRNFSSAKESGVIISDSKVQDITAGRQADGDFHRNTLLEHPLVALWFKVRVRLLHRGFRQFCSARIRLDLEGKATVLRIPPPNPRYVAVERREP